MDPQLDTAQRRAAELVSAVYNRVDVRGILEGDALGESIEIIATALVQTRRAALLEAAKLVGDYNCMHDHGKKATKACDDVFDELHRLAQER